MLIKNKDYPFRNSLLCLVCDFFYFKVTRVTPSNTESPSATSIEATTPSWVAWMAFSIFIASNVITVCPRFTWSPILTLIATIIPGSGDFTAAPPALLPAAFGADADATGRWILGVTGSSSFFSNSTLYEVPFTSTYAKVSSILSTATS